MSSLSNTQPTNIGWNPILKFEGGEHFIHELVKQLFPMVEVFLREYLEPLRRYDPDRGLTVAQAADLLGYSTKKVRTLVSNRKLDAYRSDEVGDLRVTMSSVKRFQTLNRYEPKNSRSPRKRRPDKS